MRIDFAEQIKERVSMRDVLRLYPIGNERNNLIKCPIHQGNDYNFHIYEKSFYCFSRCGGGDVIRFVELMENTDFKGACKFIDNAFRLGLYEPMSRAELLTQRRRQKERDRERAEREAKERYSREQWKILIDYRNWLEQQPKTAEILFDIQYIDRLTERYQDPEKLIEFDVQARIEALKTKHNRGENNGNY